MRIQRVYSDLVTRAQIAERAGVTRQAVGLWIRGERHTDPAFPEPHVLGGGGLWLWRDVDQWLAEVGLPHDEVSYPTHLDIARVERTSAPAPALASLG